MFSVRQVDNVLNNRDRLLYKRPFTNKKSSAPTHGNLDDVAEISPILTVLSRSGMDIKESYTIEVSSKQSFHFEFKTDAFEKLIVNGYYEPELKKVSILYQYFFQKELIIEDNPGIKFFVFNLNYGSTEYDKPTYFSFEKNDEILTDMQEIRKHTEYLFLENKTFPEVTCRFNDLKALSENEKNDYLNKLNSLTGKILFLTEMRNSLDTKDFVGDIKLESESEEKDKLLKINDSDISNDFRIEIKEINKNEN